MEFNEIYKAPSIPKLSRRTISSPFGQRSAITAPKLKKTSFSFIKGIKSVPSAIFQTPEEKKEQESRQGLSKVLFDTNKIFGEIRDQLVLDFATRIDDAKKSLSKFKQDSYKKRRSLKEGLITGVKSIGSGIMNQVSQVLGPTKSIFQKIIDFFQIILTGIVLNTAFKWLQKKENQEKLIKIFKFVADHWKELLILFGTYKLLRLLFKIASIAKTIGGFFRRKPPGGPGGGTPNICNQILNCFGNPATVTSLAQNLLKNAIFLGGVKGLVAARPQPAPKPVGSPPLTPAPIPSLVKNLKPTLAGSLVNQIAGDTRKAFDPKTPGMFANLFKGTNLNIDWGSLGALGGGILSTLGSLLFQPAQAAEGGTIEKPKKKKCTACSLGFSPGGTVPGRGKPKADDVPAWLSTGEEVINAAMAMLWRPLLKDINENGGRIFDFFRKAVIKFNDVVASMISNSKVFRDITEEFNKYLKDQIRKKKLKDLSAEGGGTGGGIAMKSSAMPSLTNDKPEQRLTGKSGIIGQNLPTPNTQSLGKANFSSNVNQNINLNVSTSANKISRITPVNYRSANPVIVPMTLPPITGKMPEIQTPTPTSSEVPSISSVNMANPYMQRTLSTYGIYVV